jgi:hypothetical protein
MHEEMKTEAMELCVTACEKFSANNEVIKNHKIKPFKKSETILTI